MLGTLIEKEDITKYKFVASSNNKTEDLYHKLSDAQRLGNEFKSKTTIIFNSENGPLRVETTVWSVTDKYIQIKNGILIPLSAIIQVEF